MLKSLSITCGGGNITISGRKANINHLLVKCLDLCEGNDVCGSMVYFIGKLRMNVRKVIGAYARIK